MRPKPPAFPPVVPKRSRLQGRLPLELLKRFSVTILCIPLVLIRRVGVAGVLYDTKLTLSTKFEGFVSIPMAVIVLIELLSKVSEITSTAHSTPPIK